MISPPSATHRCKVCRALWILNADKTWTAVSAHFGKCCDNVPMGDQIEAIGSAQELLAKELRELLQALRDEVRFAMKGGHSRHGGGLSQFGHGALAADKAMAAAVKRRIDEVVGAHIVVRPPPIPADDRKWLDEQAREDAQ